MPLPDPCGSKKPPKKDLLIAAPVDVSDHSPPFFPHHRSAYVFSPARAWYSPDTAPDQWLIAGSPILINTSRYRVHAQMPGLTRSLEWVPKIPCPGPEWTLDEAQTLHVWGSAHWFLAWEDLPPDEIFWICDLFPSEKPDLLLLDLSACPVDQIQIHATGLNRWSRPGESHGTNYSYIRWSI